MTKKSSKKALKIATSTALIASAIIPVASVSAQTFKDVGENSLFKKEIEYLYSRQIVSGYPDGTFKPDNHFTRAEVVYLLGQFLVSMGRTIPSDYKDNIRFEDLKGKNVNENLLKYSAVVFDSKIFVGRGNGVLDPNTDITREEAATVMVKLLETFLDVNLTEFVSTRASYPPNISDIANAAPIMRNNIYALRELGVTVNTIFFPKAKIKRGEYAAFVYRALVDVLDNADLLAEIERFKNPSSTPGITLGTLTVDNIGASIRVTGAKAGQEYEVHRGATKIGEATIGSSGNATIAVSPRLTTGETIKIKVKEGSASKEFDYTVPTVIQPIGPIDSDDQLLENALNTLKALIDAILNMDRNDFTSESWEALLTILAQSISMIQNDNATIVDVDNLITQLLNAIRDLVPVDNTDAEKIISLKETITNLSNLVNTLNRDLYTTESWNNLQTALNAARALLVNQNVTVNTLVTAINNLIDAINSLVLKDDENNDGLSDALLAELNALLAEIRAMDSMIYTTASWANLESKVSLADGSYANDAEITSIINQIKAAKDALVVKGDKSSLDALIRQAEGSYVEVSADGNDILPSKKWTTSAERQTFVNAITAAKLVYDDPNATAAQISAAGTTLQQAIDAYNVAKKDGKQALSVNRAVLSTSLESSTLENDIRLGGITNGNIDINFATLGVGVGGVVDVSALGNTATDTKFTVPADKRYTMGFNFTMSGVLGTGQMFLNILKDKGNGQYELVWRDGLNYFTLLGIPLQNKYTFGVSDLEPGDYVFVAEKGSNLNLDVIAGSAFVLNSNTTYITNYSGEVNSSSPAVTTGLSGNLLTANSLTTANADVTSINGVTVSAGPKVINGMHGAMEVVGDTGAFTYKSFGRPTSIGQVDVFEYEVTHSDGRKGKEKVYVQYGGTANGTTIPVSFDPNDPGKPYVFNTASAKTGSVALTRGANQTDSPLTTAPITSSLWASSDDMFDSTFNIDIAGQDNIVAFDPYVSYSLTDTLRYRFIEVDSSGRPISNGGNSVKFEDGKDYFDIDTSLGKRVEVQGLKPGRYRIKVQSLNKRNHYFGMRNLVVTRSTWDESLSEGNLNTGNTISSNSKLVVNGITVSSANTYVYGEHGRLTISPNGDYRYDTKYTQQRPNSVITTDNYEPRSEMIGKKEQFVYYYLAPNGSMAKSTLIIDISSTNQPLAMTATSHQVKTATMATPLALNLRYTLSDKFADAGSTVDYE